MLLELAQWLAKDIHAFNVFGYITLRAVLAISANAACVAMVDRYAVSAGSHTVLIQWRTSGNTARIRPVASAVEDAHIVVCEVSA